MSLHESTSVCGSCRPQSIHGLSSQLRGVPGPVNNALLIALYLIAERSCNETKAIRPFATSTPSCFKKLHSWHRLERSYYRLHTMIVSRESSYSASRACLTPIDLDSTRSKHHLYSICRCSSQAFGFSLSMSKYLNFRHTWHWLHGQLFTSIC